jgi:hypothetical protein
MPLVAAVMTGRSEGFTGSDPGHAERREQRGDDPQRHTVSEWVMQGHRITHATIATIVPNAPIATAA